MRIKIAILAITVLFVMIVSILAKEEQPSQEAKFVPFNELVSNPEEYNNQYVCTEGIYLSCFEIRTLGESTYQKDDGYTFLTEPTIWLSRNSIVSKDECFKTNYVFNFCHAKACGYFQYGGRYGPSGGYAYQLYKGPEHKQEGVRIGAGELKLPGDKKKH